MNNIDHVAQKAGVSRSTVSRVIRNSPNVSESTKMKVESAIAELNYIPNTAARALASKGNNVIGIICGYSLNDPFFSTFIETVCKKLGKYGYGTFISADVGEYSTPKRQIEFMQGKVDSYIFVGQLLVKKEDIERLLYNGIPVVLFKTGIFVEGAINIDIDNEESAKLAVRYLTSLGHRKIAYVRGDMGHYETVLRMKGYEYVLRENQIEFDESLVWDGRFRYKNVYLLVEEILSHKPTAVFFDSDVMAHGFVAKCNRQGIKIPEEISIIGFDGIDFVNFEPFVNFTTIKQPVVEMAEACVDALINQKDKGCDLKFLTTVLERNSVKNIL